MAIESALDELDPDPGPVDMGEQAHLDEDGAPRIVERRFVVAPEHRGQRLDHYLKRMIPRLSRTRIQRIIDSQLRRLDGDERPLKASTAVFTGDTFAIRREAQPEPPCPRTFGILHEDDDLLVIDKPAGLPVHASAKFYFNTLTRVMSERFPGASLQICHRLDRETSGALVVAKSSAAAASIKGDFAAGRVAKTYLAVVEGAPPWAGHVIDRPLAVATSDDDTLLPGVRMIQRPRGEGLPARTKVHLAARHGRYSLIECHPQTGRQHQIRAHLAFEGFPIVGDKLYAHGDLAFMAYCDQGLTAELAARFVLPRQALHAAALRFRHPRDGVELEVRSPLAPELQRFLDEAGAR